MNAITMPDLRPQDRQSVQGGVAVRGLTRRFGDNTVLDALDLDLSAGSFTALLGRSGSGKTTLLRTLAASIRPRPAPASRCRTRSPSRSRSRGCCRGSRCGATSRSA